MNKYGAKRTYIDGLVFDSKREAQYYKDYRLLVKSGEIKSMTLQPTFVLLAKCKNAEGKTIRSIKYSADFKLEYPDGRIEIIDVKSEATKKNAVYMLKKKLFESKYPYVIKEVS